MLNATENKIVYNQKRETAISLIVFSVIFIVVLVLLAILFMAGNILPLFFKVFFIVYISAFALLLPYALFTLLFGLTAEYVFDADGIRLKSIFFKKTLLWENVVDYGFTFSWQDLMSFDFARADRHVVLYFSDKKLKSGGKWRKKLGFTVFRFDGSLLTDKDIVLLRHRRQTEVFRTLFDFARRHIIQAPHFPAEIQNLLME